MNLENQTLYKNLKEPEQICGAIGFDAGGYDSLRRDFTKVAERLNVEGTKFAYVVDGNLGRIYVEKPEAKKAEEMIRKMPGLGRYLVPLSA